MQTVFGILPYVLEHARFFTERNMQRATNTPPKSRGSLSICRHDRDVPGTEEPCRCLRKPAKTAADNLSICMFQPPNPAFGNLQWRRKVQEAQPVRGAARFGRQRSTIWKAGNPKRRPSHDVSSADLEKPVRSVCACWELCVENYICSQPARLTVNNLHS